MTPLPASSHRQRIRRTTRARALLPRPRRSMGMVRVALRQRHIDEGFASNSHCCPVALALDQGTRCPTPYEAPVHADAPSWGVYTRSATFLPRESPGREYILGPELRSWIARFDSRNPGSVRPGILQVLEGRVELVHEDPAKPHAA